VRSENDTCNKVPLPWEGTSFSAHINKFVLDLYASVLCDYVYEQFRQIMVHTLHIFSLLKFVTVVQFSDVCHPLVANRFSCHIVRSFMYREVGNTCYLAGRRKPLHGLSLIQQILVHEYLKIMTLLPNKHRDSLSAVSCRMGLTADLCVLFV